MPNYQRILFPVDLSQMSISALALATSFAKQHSAKLCFVYVSPPLLPVEAMYGAAFTPPYDKTVKLKLESLRPSEKGVEFEHLFLQGNAGPEIVRVSEPNDLVVLCTHGRSAILRLLMGSVAQYVLGNANCPVILARGLAEVTPEEDPSEKHFVTEIMDHIAPVHKHTNIVEVARQLNASGQTGAPVVDINNKCIGILTTVDIENYESIKKRYEEKDPTVLKDAFEVDKYGLRRFHNHNFNYVERHMTTDVVSISNSQSILEAIELFRSNPEIHHLVVVDEKDRPVGIVDSIRAITSAEFGETRQIGGDDLIEKDMGQ